MEFLIFLLPVLIVIIIAIAKVAIKKKQTKCKKCNTKYTYENDVSWEVISESIKNNGKERTANVRFKCVCPKCGTERTFTREFTTARVNDTQNIVNEYNLENQIKRYYGWNK